MQAVCKKSTGGGKQKSEKIIMNEKPDPIANLTLFIRVPFARQTHAIRSLLEYLQCFLL